ncbi:hypothetical protein EVAR_64637_1 [Eumeta japonica]|uniref:Uncharacterized protein n=1 Tax=Eumeta variegata TaxID=151549 RepID=A0A4C1ZBM2_EUMVA|nr:hypothetical protein EVAR_64637_1 [Eumeta japonica]
MHESGCRNAVRMQTAPERPRHAPALDDTRRALRRLPFSSARPAAAAVIGSSLGFDYGERFNCRKTESLNSAWRFTFGSNLVMYPRAAHAFVANGGD